MHNHVPIENEIGMARDITSHAIICNAKNKIVDYTAKRTAAEQRDNAIKNHEQQINSLKNDIASIKDMLTALMQR
jgi:hypothetical protein